MPFADFRHPFAATAATASPNLVCTLRRATVEFAERNAFNPMNPKTRAAFRRFTLTNLFPFVIPFRPDPDTR